MHGVIYLLTNNNNKKQYVGKTRNLEQRMKYYASPSSDDKSPIANAMRTHGGSTFTYRVLKQGQMTDKQLQAWESYYIKQYNTLVPVGYNVQS